MRRKRAVISAPAGFMCSLGLLVLHAGACDAHRPVAPAPIAMSVPVTVSPMGSPEEKPRVVVDPAVLPPLISDEEAIAQMDEAMKQGRVFRHLFVGGMRGISVTRITWILRDTAEEAVLDVFCEAFRRGPGVRKKSGLGISDRYPSLVGEANRRDLWWSPPSITHYGLTSFPQSTSKMVFKRKQGFDTPTGRQASRGWPTCGIMPLRITLLCERGQRLVRPRGAHLVFHRVNSENLRVTSWVPPHRHPTSGLSCLVGEAEEHERMEQQESRIRKAIPARLRGVDIELAVSAVRKDLDHHFISRL